VIRVYDGIGNVIEIHEHAGDFKESVNFPAMAMYYAMGATQG
jgi:hypothetical protein